MSDLASKSCVPCEGGTPPLAEDEVKRLLGELDGWRLSAGAAGVSGASGSKPEIEKEYRFPDFREALA
ncbi:MAG TPA: hypothetical protein VEG34_04065, partial [Thermoanaerobaculia bacterium]|nr:hypothetical protein [Thermoanaerobaculia bacterium]